MPQRTTFPERRSTPSPAAPADLPDTRFLTLGHGLALALLAAATLATGGWMSRLVDRQTDNAEIIQIATAQSMQLQRLAALAPLLATAPGPGDNAGPSPAGQVVAGSEARVRFAEALFGLQRAHERLNRAPDAPTGQSPALRRHYLGGDGVTPATGLNGEVTRLLAQGHAVLAQAQAQEQAQEQAQPQAQAQSQAQSQTHAQALAGPAVTAAAWQALQAAALGPLPAALDEAVHLHQAAADTELAAARRFQHAAVGATLLLLVGVAFGIFRPLAQRVARQAAQLAHSASHDALTGALNREAVRARLASVLAQGMPVAVIAVDLDRFKQTNDSEGPAAGDALLQATTERLRQAARAGDLVGRVGGDEFMVVLLGCSGPDAAHLAAERMRQALHRPVEFLGRPLRLGATLGVTLATDGTQAGRDAAAVMRLADEALVQARLRSRGAIGRAGADDAQRLARERSIRVALADLEGAGSAGLTVVYQPIFHLLPDGRAGDFRAVEALARWQHPVLGALSPVEFLSVAQRCGRMPELGLRLWAQALREYAALSRLPGGVGRLALNLSAAELAAGNLVETLEAQAATAGVALERLKLEITEDVLLADVSPQVVQQLLALQAKGVTLSMDDFGTGTSGLSQLLALPFGTVKIDRCFVSVLTTDRRAEAIIRATLSMADVAGFDVVAEGIETAEQGARLAALGCDGVQGYHYARPMPASALADWQRQRQTGSTAAGGERPDRTAPAALS